MWEIWLTEIAEVLCTCSLRACSPRVCPADCWLATCLFAGFESLPVFSFPPGVLLTQALFPVTPCLRSKDKAHLRVKTNVRVLVPPVLESVTTAIRNANSKVTPASSLHLSNSVTLTLPSMEKGCRAWTQHQLWLLPELQSCIPRCSARVMWGFSVGGGAGNEPRASCMLNRPAPLSWTLSPL